ncbi:carboxypeptidase-like regulatory domain-containing protein [Pseudomonas sp. CGJS7]|uniref:carboxypeptidase-like regulatory domain-containing protein n=1 Tax=Pseudomonas sp. CGJS7 TaxID=3109348 RepID=UPI003008778F
MSPPRTFVRHRLAACLAVALAAVGACAHAGESAASDAGASASAGEGRAVAPGEYRDRIIAAQSLAPLPPDEDEDRDSSGLPRSLRLQLDLARNEQGQQRYDEQGLSAGGYWETADWGSWSLDATVFHSDRERDNGRGGSGGAATLWQRGLFLDGGWRVDNGLGAINTPSLDLQRNQYRFFLPTVSLAGLSTQWHRDADGLSVYGAYGRAGVYRGTRVVGFDLADGQVGALGAQWRPAPGWTASASLLSTDGRIVPDALGQPDLAGGSSQAVHWAAAWGSARDSVQINLLNSRGPDPSALDPGAVRRDASGGWIDASAKRGRLRHQYGVFSLDPGLVWGALPINRDVRGGYYRIGYQYGRWIWNAGVDDIRSISGEGFDGQYATAFARYQASSALGYGASASLRHVDGSDSYAVQGFLDRRSDWGLTRLQLDRADGGGSGASWQASIDQALPLREGRRLSVSLGYGELHYEDQGSTRGTTLSVYGGIELGQRWSLDGNARWTRGDGPSALRGVDLNVGLNWRIAPGWGLSAALYQSRGSQRSPFALDPLALDSPFQNLPRQRSGFLTLRYDYSAGRALPVIGGAPGAATGDIAGSIFLDDNGDGVRAASELAAANITVVLDGRYSVRTDSNGQFAFERVSVGAHRVQAIADNLPLPWSLEEGAVPVTVEVRDTRRVDIGATRAR